MKDSIHITSITPRWPFLVIGSGVLTLLLSSLVLLGASLASVEAQESPGTPPDSAQEEAVQASATPGQPPDPSKEGETATEEKETAVENEEEGEEKPSGPPRGTPPALPPSDTESEFDALIGFLGFTPLPPQTTLRSPFIMEESGKVEEKIKLDVRGNQKVKTQDSGPARRILEALRVGSIAVTPRMRIAVINNRRFKEGEERFGLTVERIERDRVKMRLGGISVWKYRTRWNEVGRTETVEE